MHSTTQQILDAVDDPIALEALYRLDPTNFRDALPEALEAAPQATTLAVWHARLSFRTSVRLGGINHRFLTTLLIALSAGALVRLPAIWLGDEWYYPRFAPTLVLLSLVAYFWHTSRYRVTLMIGVILAFIAAVWASILPGETPSVVMALIHLPLLAWIVLGFAFTADDWRDPNARIRFIRYNGELLILGSLVGLGGMVFSGLTAGLFSFVWKDAPEWYFSNIGVMGASAVPVVATYLYDVVFSRYTGIASVLARIFAPLFLVMTSTYLAVAIAGGRNPFSDREFLIIVNGLVLVVLGMTVFSVIERGERARMLWIDRVNLALLMLTLIIDLLALSAILFRLSSYGFSPNRVVVLGANLVVMGHLARTGLAYRKLTRSADGAANIRRAVTGYLPVYAVWAAFVTFILPLVFRFA